MVRRHLLLYIGCCRARHRLIPDFLSPHDPLPRQSVVARPRSRQVTRCTPSACARRRNIASDIARMSRARQSAPHPPSCAANDSRSARVSSLRWDEHRYAGT